MCVPTLWWRCSFEQNRVLRGLLSCKPTLEIFLQFPVKKRECNLKAAICRTWDWNPQQFLLWMTSYNHVGRMLELDFESAPYSQAPFTLERSRAQTFKAWIKAFLLVQSLVLTLLHSIPLYVWALEPRAQTLGWSPPHGEILEHRTMIL